MRDLDYAILQWINGWSNSLNPFLKFFSIALNLAWVKVALGIFLIVLLVRNAKSRTAALVALISVGIGNTMTNIWKSALPMARPFQDFPYSVVSDSGVVGPVQNDHGAPFHVFLRVGWSDSFGTASAHSANMAALAFVMCYYFRWWGSPWVLVAVLTGISRVYTGAHYPVQVLLGWLTGLLAAFVVIKTWEAFRRVRTGVQSEEDETPELA